MRRSAHASLRRWVLGLAAALCLSSCAFGDAQSADEGLALAQELHTIPIAGFEFSEINGPDLGFDYNNPNSSFIATPMSGKLTKTECEALSAWIKSNLTEIFVSLQYSRGATGQEVTACLTAIYGLLPNSSPGLEYSGMYSGLPVTVSFEGATNGQIGIAVYGGGDTGADSQSSFAVNSDLANEVQKLLREIAAFRSAHKIKSFTNAEVSDFWNAYKSENATSGTLTWVPGVDGKVRSVLAKNFGGLNPFNLWIDPVDKDLIDTEIGPEYLFVLGLESGPKSFGFAWPASS